MYCDLPTQGLHLKSYGFFCLYISMSTKSFPPSLFECITKRHQSIPAYDRSSISLSVRDNLEGSKSTLRISISNMFLLSLISVQCLTWSQTQSLSWGTKITTQFRVAVWEWRSAVSTNTQVRYPRYLSRCHRQKGTGEKS